jgi:hypothetical protein
MRNRRWQAPSILTVALLSLGLGLGVAVAHAAGADDRTATEALLREVEASPKKEVATEMIARSRAALDRAARLRSAGAEPHAILADGLARTWAEAARDVIRAVDVEEKARTTRLAATDAGVIAERERALLEEGIAQSGRLRAQLESVEREAKEQPARTSAAANTDADGGAGKPRPKAPTTPTTPTTDGGAGSTSRDGGAK